LIRIKSFNSTGISPNGVLFAGDLNSIQDAAAGQADFTQTIDLNTLRIGETGLQLLRFGTGDARVTGALRTDGILRGLGGFLGGSFTTTQRDAIATGFAPFTLVIFNVTTNQYEVNMGSDVSRNWQPLSSLISSVAGAGLALTGNVLSVNVDGTTIQISGDTLSIPATVAKTAVVATTIAGAGAASDGKMLFLVTGSSPYEFLLLTYSATYGKWVSAKESNLLGIGNGGQNGNNTSYSTSLSNANFTQPLPWAVFNTAGLKPQFRGRTQLLTSSGTGFARLAYQPYHIGTGAGTLVHLTGSGAEQTTTTTSGQTWTTNSPWVDIDGGFTADDLIIPGFAWKSSGGSITWNISGLNYLVDVRWVA
jgi:hypothetical protein